VAEPSGSPPGLSNRNRKQSITVTPVLEFLTVGTVKKAELRHRAKFLADRSNRCGDMAIFLFFKMAAVRHLGFVMPMFGPSTKGIWWSLSLCNIWLK